jgi:hypothetical protein
MKAFLTFVVVCAGGLLVGSAGGVHWGTMDAGFLCGLTLGVASVMSGVVKFMGDIGL